MANKINCWKKTGGNLINEQNTICLKVAMHALPKLRA